MAPHGDNASTNSILIITGFIVGTLFLGVLFLAPNFMPCPPSNFIAKVILALAAGGFAAGLTGSIVSKRRNVTAAGGFAIFMLIILIPVKSEDMFDNSNFPRCPDLADTLFEDRNKNGIEDYLDDNTLVLFDGGKHEIDRYPKKIVYLPKISTAQRASSSGCISLHNSNMFFANRVSYLQWNIPGKFKITLYTGDNCNSRMDGTSCTEFDTRSPDDIKGELSLVALCNDQLSSIRWQRVD